MYTNKGKRDINEDSLDICQNNESCLAIVADGLGGHENGEVASHIAVDSVINFLANKEFDEDELLYALIFANDQIIKANISGHSTAAALWINDDTAFAGHVGDTRIYQFRDDKIVFQSVDHSIVQLSVLVGDLSIDDLRNHKDRNKLYRVLGDPATDLKPSSDEVGVRSGDHFLLCSDGFWEVITESIMLETLSRSSSPQSWLDEMVRIIETVDAPKQDNYTAICICCSGV